MTVVWFLKAQFPLLKTQNTSVPAFREDDIVNENTLSVAVGQHNNK